MLGATRERYDPPAPRLPSDFDLPGFGRGQSGNLHSGVARIALEQLTKVYPDGTKAVDELDLDVEDGEFVVLVGPSGCGKTTALRMVAGLEEITEGRVRIGERVVNDLPPKNRDIAMVFQSYALYPHMSARDNMAFGLKMRHETKGLIERRVQGAARLLGLAEALEKKPRTLSGGQRQRVAMGRSIVREPQAFLMDEPLSNLDAKLRVQMRAEISRLQRDLEVTTIYVTHDQVEAMTMGDRVAVMHDGVLQQVDRPQALYDRPANLFVAGFIGSPSGTRPPRATPAWRIASASASSSASARRTSRTRLSRTGASAGRRSRPWSTSARTWAPKSSSTSASTPTRCARTSSPRRSAPRRSRPRRPRGREALPSSPGSTGRRGRRKAARSSSSSTRATSTSSTRRPAPR